MGLGTPPVRVEARKVGGGGWLRLRITAPAAAHSSVSYTPVSTGQSPLRLPEQLRKPMRHRSVFRLREAANAITVRLATAARLPPMTETFPPAAVVAVMPADESPPDAASPASTSFRQRFARYAQRRPLVAVAGAAALVLVVGALVWLAWPRAPGFADPSLGRPLATVPATPVASPASPQAPEVVAALADLKAAKERYTEQVDGWLAAMRSGAPALDKLSERIAALAEEDQALHTAIDRVRVVADDAAVKLSTAFADQAGLKARLDDAEARLRALGEALRERQTAEQALIERVTKLEGRLNPLPARRAAAGRTGAARGTRSARALAPAVGAHIVAVEYRDNVPYAVVETAGDAAVPVRLGSRIDGWRVVADPQRTVRLVPAGATP